MGNTQSNETTELQKTDNSIQTSESSKSELTTPITPITPVRSIKTSIKASFRNDFGSNSPVVGSPLLSLDEHKKFEDGYFEDSQNEIYASNFNEGYIYTDIDGPSRAISIRRQSEPSYKNSNKVIHDFSASGGIAPLTRANVQGTINKGVPTIITWSQGGNNVYVTGTFNEWKRNIRLCKSSKDFTTVLNLPPGTHKLKFIVDDEWKCSNELSTATDPDGNLVNYLEVFEEEGDSMDQNGMNADDLLSSTPPGEYTDEIPGYLLAYAHSRNIIENNISSSTSKRDSIETRGSMTGEQPPTLPPHLGKVLLNSSAVSKEDNSVLPVPNHVVLNHLYACSIRDGVMAVAATARYRKKYMTIVFYKPIII
ncbi:AMPKBI-domain-containing protein [Gigaspora margarita]|uniref:AMPKBI-domain-containing protein n=1 Tax=Gigaspora margarita TaxID=4874 RepID=A0A8H4AGR4_GIGMA|nr:AMPKBI-domain-containing protein [Gigaspora margarita]